MEMKTAIEIGERLGVLRNESSCDYSYLFRVREAITDNNGNFNELSYIQSLIDQLESLT